jgi:ABC-2 type transport system ATP-binding protein
VYAPQIGVPTARCDEVLDLVGLSDAANRRVGGFSMGMRQRLGLAATLLGDPKVLLLDEPANGLDPEGIVWLRALLRFLASEGRTVLISSHVLSEVQQTVDDVVIIAKGRLVHASALAGLAQLVTRQVQVTSPDVEGLAALAAAQWPGLAVAGDRPGTLVVRDVEAATVGAAAFAARVELHELATRDVGLEDVFLRLTGDDAATPPPDPGVGAADPTAHDETEGGAA